MALARNVRGCNLHPLYTAPSLLPLFWSLFFPLFSVLLDRQPKRLFVLRLSVQ